MSLNIKRAICPSLFSIRIAFLSAVIFSIFFVSMSQANEKFGSAKLRPASSDTAIAGQYIVVLKEATVAQQAAQLSSHFAVGSQSAQQLRDQAVSNMVQQMAGAYGLNITRQYTTALSGFVTTADQRAIKYMLADPNIDYIEQDQIMSIDATQFNATWGLDRLDQASLPLNSQYVYNLDGRGVRAYILDTGILGSHSNFGGRVGSGFTAVNDGNGTRDCNGHGTHVAGTVGSTTYGVAKNVTLIPVRVLGCTGSGSNSGVIAGVDWVARNATRPAVANMSLGGGASGALDSAVVRAVNAGVTFAVAAGNDNRNACGGSPSRAPRALTVASSTRSDGRSGFSNWGSCVDIFGPGSSITSTWSNGGTRTISGTSMATPHVAGVAALYLGANRSASPAQVERALESAAARNKISNVRGSPNLLVQTSFGGGSSSSSSSSSSSNSSSSSSGGNQGQAIPGRIQAENFSSQSGTRTQTVNGDTLIGFIQTGDSLTFNTRVNQAGSYNVVVRVASATRGGTMNFSANGRSVGSVTIPGTGGWFTWTTVSTRISLGANQQTLKLDFGGNSGFLFNVDWLDFSRNGGSGATDQCDTTAQCKNLFGNRATDCRDSRSNQSVCYCGSSPCQ